MTTTPIHHPSPADLAARSPARKRAAARLAEMLAPAELAGAERFRPLFDIAVRTSGMTAHTRLTALTLATYANGRTGAMGRQPGLHGLATATGLSAGQVVIALRVLEQRGWVKRTGPMPYETALLRPVIPNHSIDRARDGYYRPATTRETTDA
ncbi:hypothetical protein AB0K62_08810 [Streptomyces halstedii]|uniref:hypothetical protein n=1 Tax=Streptomyces halstedii TaxID=1944 RepID=UPI003460A62D